jgi:hypothetical protein
VDARAVLTVGKVQAGGESSCMRVAMTKAAATGRSTRLGHFGTSHNQGSKLHQAFCMKRELRPQQEVQEGVLVTGRAVTKQPRWLYLYRVVPVPRRWPALWRRGQRWWVR